MLRAPRYSPPSHPLRPNAPMTSSTPLNKRSVSRSLSLLPRRLSPPSSPPSTLYVLVSPSSPSPPVLHLSRSTRMGMQRRAVSRTQRPDCRTPGEICQSPPITGISLPSLHFYAVFAVDSRNDDRVEEGDGERGTRRENMEAWNHGGGGTRGTKHRWKYIEIQGTM